MSHNDVSALSVSDILADLKTILAEAEKHHPVHLRDIPDDELQLLHNMLDDAITHGGELADRHEPCVLKKVRLLVKDALEERGRHAAGRPPKAVTRITRSLRHGADDHAGVAA